MSWRPNDWENPYFLKDVDGGHYNKYPEFEVYEAGADAMLKAIWALAEESPTGTFTLDSKIQYL